MTQFEGVTNVDDVALPMEVVELEFLRTVSGQPVRVLCEAVNELVIAEAFKALPGDGPKANDDAALDDDEAMRRIAMARKMAEPLIEQATALASEGGLLRPAFYFGAVAPHPRCIPGRMLREADVMKLLETICRLGGYGGATPASFHGADGTRGGNGVGTVAAVPGHGNAAAQDVPADNGPAAPSGTGV